MIECLITELVTPRVWLQIREGMNQGWRLTGESLPLSLELHWELVNDLLGATGLVVLTRGQQQE
jgi:hypothetical protein